MVATLDKVYINTYEQTVRHLAQQGIARLRPWTMERSVQSEAHNWERLGPVEAVTKSAREATPIDDYPFSRRVSSPSTYHTGDVVDQEDIVQMLIDPNSAIAMAQAKSMRRAVDKEIITAASADAAPNGDGGTDTLDPNQIIDNAGAAVPMTYDLVTEVVERFLNKDVEPTEERVFVIGPAQARKILQLTEATSSDYNHARDLYNNSYIDKWMGFTWVVSTQLEAPAAGESYCFAMTKKAIGLQMNKDVWARVAEDPTMSFAWRIYAAGTFGAVRVEDEHIVRCRISDTI